MILLRYLRICWCVFTLHSLVWVLWHSPSYWLLIFQCLTLGKILQKVLPQILFQVLFLSYTTISHGLHFLWGGQAPECSILKLPVPSFSYAFQFRNSSISWSSEVVSSALPTVLMKSSEVILLHCLSIVLFVFLRTCVSAYIMHALLCAAYILSSAFQLSFLTMYCLIII